MALTVCVCGRHARAGAACPFCGATTDDSVAAVVVGRVPRAVLVGLAAVGLACKEPPSNEFDAQLPQEPLTIPEAGASAALDASVVSTDASSDAAEGGALVDHVVLEAGRTQPPNPILTTHPMYGMAPIPAYGLPPPRRPPPEM